MGQQLVTTEHLIWEKWSDISLQKQIGWFNHWVVTLVADKPKRQWLCTMCFADYKRQLERKLPRLSYNHHVAVSNHWTSVQQQPRFCRYSDHWTSVRESPAFVKGIIFVKCDGSDSLTDVLWVVSCNVWFGLRLLMQLASSTKIHLTQSTLCGFSQQGEKFPVGPYCNWHAKWLLV